MNKNKKNESNSMNKKISDSNDLSSVNMVSEGTEISGKFMTKSDVRIAGKIDGEAKVDGKIIVASPGYIDGNINATNADIAGRIEGEVHVSGNLTLRKTAVVEGDLFAQNLVVEEGATFNGQCHMRDLKSQKPKKDKLNYKTSEKTKNGKPANKDKDKEKIKD